MPLVVALLNYMRNFSKIWESFAIILIIFFGLVFLKTLKDSLVGESSVRKRFSSPSLNIASTTKTSKQERNFSLPSRLIIPSLNIDANIQHVGLDHKGNVGIPNNFSDVAWYEESVIPGHSGVAVISGHLDNGIKLPGVFKNLQKIKIGDSVNIIDANNITEEYIVNNIKELPYNAKIDQVLFDADVPTISLITCDGSWIESSKTYGYRVIIYAALKEQ
jgi:LPXTG-site transpeptidase (sortase) family protein